MQEVYKKALDTALGEALKASAQRLWSFFIKNRALKDHGPETGVETKVKEYGSVSYEERHKELYKKEHYTKIQTFVVCDDNFPFDPEIRFIIGLERLSANLPIGRHDRYIFKAANKVNLTNLQHFALKHENMGARSRNHFIFLQPQIFHKAVEIDCDSFAKVKKLTVVRATFFSGSKSDRDKLMLGAFGEGVKQVFLECDSDSQIYTDVKRQYDAIIEKNAKYSRDLSEFMPNTQASELTFDMVSSDKITA